MSQTLTAVATTTQCRVCDASIEKPLYLTDDGVSITSLCEIYPGKTEVFFCENCAHLQTTEIENIDDYYDTTYEILIESDEEDQIYKVVNNQPIYRLNHQAEVLLKKLDIPQGAKVLDYGCAKGASLRKVIQQRQDLVPHLFDVSEMYKPFWEKFVKPENWATYEPKPEWKNHFELITSFYALEHVAQPKDFMAAVYHLLQPNGTFYCIIPNVLEHLSDFVVVDHVNHFTSHSLRYLFEQTGLVDVEIDTTSHEGAFIATGKKPAQPVDVTPTQDADVVTKTQALANKMAADWEAMGQRIQRFEEEYSHEKTAAIYGSGFFGTFIATRLKNLEKVTCFIDQNPYKQGKTLFEKPIVAPDAVADNVKVIYVGLKPQIAKQAMADIASFQDKGHHYFYL